MSRCCSASIASAALPTATGVGGCCCCCCCGGGDGLAVDADSAGGESLFEAAELLFEGGDGAGCCVGLLVVAVAVGALVSAAPAAAIEPVAVDLESVVADLVSALLAAAGLVMLLVGSVNTISSRGNEYSNGLCGVGVSAVIGLTGRKSTLVVGGDRPMPSGFNAI